MSSLILGLASVLLDTREAPEAEVLCREALEGYRRTSGTDDPATLSTMNQLGVALLRQENWPEAEAVLQEAVDTGTRVLGPEHPHVLGFLNNLASVLRAEEKLDQAEAVYRRMLPVAERVLGTDHPNLQTLRTNLGEALVKLGRPAEAEPFLRQAVERIGPARRDLEARYRRHYAHCLRELERFAEAEEQFIESFEAFNDSLGAEHGDTVRAIEDLVEFYEAWPKADRADAWRAKLPASPGR